MKSIFSKGKYPTKPNNISLIKGCLLDFTFKRATNLEITCRPGQVLPGRKGRDNGVRKIAPAT